MTRLLCIKCSGEGSLYTSKYGGNDPDVWRTGKCEECNGSGNQICEARGCTEQAIAFNDDGEALCEDCLAEWMTEMVTGEPTPWRAGRAGMSETAICRGCQKALRGKPYHLGGPAYDIETGERCKVNHYGGYVCSEACDRKASRELESSMPGYGVGPSSLSCFAQESIRRNWRPTP